MERSALSLSFRSCAPTTNLVYLASGVGLLHSTSVVMVRLFFKSFCWFIMFFFLFVFVFFFLLYSILSYSIPFRSILLYSIRWSRMLRIRLGQTRHSQEVRFRKIFYKINESWKLLFLFGCYNFERTICPFYPLPFEISGQSYEAFPRRVAPSLGNITKQ